MNWTLRRSEQALDDLASIWTYIAADNETAADRLIEDLLALFDRTGVFPRLGRPAEDVGVDFRVLARGSYLLIYRLLPDEEAIELVRVVHGARDWPALLEA